MQSQCYVQQASFINYEPVRMPAADRSPANQPLIAIPGNLLLVETLFRMWMIENVREVRNGIEDTQPVVVTTPPSFNVPRSCGWIKSK